LTHERYSSTPTGVEGVSNAPIENATCVRTDADGRFKLACLPQGNHVLKVLAPSRPPVLKPVTVARGMPPVLITMTPGSVLRGRVVDGSGDPVPLARLSGNQWVFNGRHPLEASGVADENGVFTIDGVPDGGEVHFMVGLSEEMKHRDPL